MTYAIPTYNVPSLAYKGITLSLEFLHACPRSVEFYPVLLLKRMPTVNKTVNNVAAMMPSGFFEQICRRSSFKK
jgi:hypothetical protein